MFKVSDSNGSTETFRVVIYDSAWGKYHEVDYCRNDASRVGKKLHLDWVIEQIQSHLRNDGLPAEITLQRQYAGQDGFIHYEIWCDQGKHGMRRRGHIYQCS